MYEPPNPKPGQRHPLVIQTHGCSEDQFAPDGKSTTAMAAQALANVDMIVIQSWGPTGWAPRSVRMARQWMNGIETLIDVLDKQGLVNRGQVGLVGWSYTGWLVEYFISHSHCSIGAAVVADNVDYGYWQYLSVANHSSGTALFHNIYGGPTWKTMDSWVKESQASTSSISMHLFVS